MSATEMQGMPPTQPVDPELNLVLPGRRGYLLGMAPAELMRVLAPLLVEVALEE